MRVASNVIAHVIAVAIPNNLKFCFVEILKGVTCLYPHKNRIELIMKSKSVHSKLSIIHFIINVLNRLLACPTEESDMYWKKNLEYMIFENDHVKDIKKRTRRHGFIRPLKRKKRITNTIIKSNITPVALSKKEVMSRGTSL